MWFSFLILNRGNIQRAKIEFDKNQSYGEKCGRRAHPAVFMGWHQSPYLEYSMHND